ncbi:MAG TPA: DUF4157 domain-containing protein [Nostocaceae cyanobacterium]|nr:DUF4157 domain-containing protein [Nostocaceae cyanobacterium]
MSKQGVKVNAPKWQPTTQATSKGNFTAIPFPEIEQQQKSASYGEKTAQRSSRLGGMIENINRGLSSSIAGASNVGIDGVQAKLTIGKVGDKYEQEADRVAAEVVQKMNASPPRKPSIPMVMRKNQINEIKAGNLPEVQADFETQLNQARGGGTPLDAAFRAKIEPAIGADFSGVRVHTDSKADQMSQGIQAKAFTTGQDVFFRQGAYQPGSRGGQELIAHELTHVVQQNGGGGINSNSQKIYQVAHKPQNQEKNLIQCQLDENFDHGGEPLANDTQQCHAFAQKVSDYVDQAYNELISGNVTGWTGAKISTFINLVFRNSSVAHTHAANAIEERVYALMSNPMEELLWTPQYTEGMGGVSKPDIVIHLSGEGEEVREALVDITSDRGHILRKGGGWTTSTRYVYVAEAYFESIRKNHIPVIKEGLNQKGISIEEATRLKKMAEDERQRKLEEKQEKQREIRKIYNEFNSFTDFANNYYKFSSIPLNQRQTVATKFLKKYGIKVKGMKTYKGKKKMSEETKKKQIQKARKARMTKEKKSVAELLGSISWKSASIEERNVLEENETTDIESTRMEEEEKG